MNEALIEQTILENNQMLKRLCAYVDKIESPAYKDARDMEAFVSNVVADLLVDNNQRQGRMNTTMFD